MRWTLAFLLIGFCTWLGGCAFVPSHPCSEAGEPARDAPFKGTKQCEQQKSSTGQYLNHGVYREWYPSGKLALRGEYRAGKKHGKWIEYDEKEKVVSEKWFEEGLEQPIPGVSPTPAPTRR